MDRLKFESEIFCHFGMRLKNIFSKLPDEILNELKEIRLKKDKPLLLFMGDRILFLNKDSAVVKRPDINTVIITKKELDDIFLSICEYSIHAFLDKISNGFVTIRGGHRVGLCGSAVCENSKVISVRDICSLNFRIARQILGVADEILYRCFFNKLSSVLIVGMPSSGKTTLLKDIANALSSARLGSYIKVAVIDERGEIASCYQGVPQNDMGISSDIYDCFPKGEGMNMALRTMSPQVVICDEIGDINDARLIMQNANAGVYTVASAHAKSLEELKNRGFLNPLFESGVFDYAVILKDDKSPGKIDKILNLKEIKNEVNISADSYSYV